MRFPFGSFFFCYFAGVPKSLPSPEDLNRRADCFAMIFIQPGNSDPPFKASWFPFTYQSTSVIGGEPLFFASFLQLKR